MLSLVLAFGHLQSLFMILIFDTYSSNFDENTLFKSCRRICIEVIILIDLFKFCSQTVWFFRRPLYYRKHNNKTQQIWGKSFKIISSVTFARLSCPLKQSYWDSKDWLSFLKRSTFSANLLYSVRSPDIQGKRNYKWWTAKDMGSNFKNENFNFFDIWKQLNITQSQNMMRTFYKMFLNLPKFHPSWHFWLMAHDYIKCQAYLLNDNFICEE